MPIALVGVGVSAYGAIQQGKAAKKAGKQAAAQMAKNDAIAAELKARHEELVDTPLRAAMAEANAKGLSKTGKMASDKLVSQFADIRRDVMGNAEYVGEGVTGARNLSVDLNEAQALANLGLEDEAKKTDNRLKLMSFGAQTPGWAQVAVGSNRDQANAALAEQEYARRAENEGWAGAAKGMAEVAAGIQNNMDKGRSWYDYGFKKKQPGEE